MSINTLLIAFLRNERASISMETAIILPLLLFLVTAGITYWNAFYSNSRSAKVAYVLSDIMGRHDAVDAVDMALLTDVHDKLLPPNVDKRRLRISSVCFESGQYRVLWSYTAASSDTSTPAPLTDAEIPVAVMPNMAPQDSIILTEIEGRWQPGIVNVGIRSNTFRSELVTRPRFVKIIPHAGLNPSNICPAA